MADEPTTPVVPEQTQVPETPAYVDELKGMNEALMGELAQVRQELDAIRNPKPAYDPTTDPDMVPPSDWKAAREEMDRRADQRAMEILRQAEADKDRMRKEEEEKVAGLKAKWDGYIDEAEKAGLVSPVGDASDPADPGNRDRAEVYMLASKLGTENLVEVARTLKAQHDAGMRFDPSKGEFVASSPNPRMPSLPAPSRSGARDEGKGIDLKVIRSASLDRLVSIYGPDYLGK